MASPTAQPGHVTLVGGGPGAWDLITVRGLRAVESADVLLTDHLGPTEQLDELCDVSDKTVIDVSKLPYGRAVAQEEINRAMVKHARAGRTVVRLKGGDPYVFGRGFEEVLACQEAGVPVTVVPGVSSAMAVPAEAGVPLTHRGAVHSFTVVSGHLPPGHPKSLVDWQALARLGGSIVVVMGMKQLPAITAALRDGGLPAHTPVTLVQEGTTQRQRILRTTLDRAAAEVAEGGFGSPAVYTIGEVAGFPASRTFG